MATFSSMSTVVTYFNYVPSFIVSDRSKKPCKGFEMSDPSKLVFIKKNLILN